MNKKRIEQLIKHNEKAEAFLITKPANISYLSGVLFPFPDFAPFRPGLLILPKKNLQFLILPLEWKGQPEAAGWDTGVHYFTINDGDPETVFVQVAAELLQKEGISIGKLAVDYYFWSAKSYQRLQTEFDHCEFSDCSEDVALMRMIKDDQEIAKLKKAAIIGDRGVIGALNHVEGTTGSSYYTLSEFLERVRVHAIEFGSDGSGFLNISQGENNRHWFSPVTDMAMVESGNVLRIDYSHQFQGYWNLCSKMISVGQPTVEAESDYAKNVQLMKFALETIKPELRISDFCASIIKKAEELNVTLASESGFGNGIGLSEVEWPLITPDNNNKFSAGMVIALEITTCDAKNCLYKSVETVVIHKSDVERISNYKNWDNLYILDGVRANH